MKIPNITKFIPNGVSSKVSIAGLKVAKNSPHLLFGAGVVGVVGTVVLASRATLKLEDILAEADAKLNAIDQLDNPDYSAEDKVKAKGLFRVKTGLAVFKLYLPAVVLGSLSIAALTGSHRILTTRNAALTAAYATIEKSFREYRARIVADVGEEKEQEYYRDIRTEKVSVTDESGKKKVVNKKTAHGAGPYARLYTESNVNSNGLPEYDIIFLRGIQKTANDMLNSRGYLMLNEVYKDLGLDVTAAGQIVGWLTKENGGVDGYVDFGIWDEEHALRVHEWAHGDTDGIWLDFNVDGPVYDKLDQV